MNDTNNSSLSKEQTLKLRNDHYSSVTEIYFRDDPLKIVKGERQYLIDDLGNKYMDCINNVAHVGHCHPTVVEAGCRQMKELYTNSRYLNDNLSTYVGRLTDLFPSPLNVCFLCNSGSEANDLALTLANAYTGGSEVVTLDSAYHGHVRSCLNISPYKWKSMSDKPDYVHVAPVPDRYRGVHANSENPGDDYALEVKKLIENINNDGKKLSCFILESLQSCGGQVIPPDNYMKQAFSYVRESGGICIADEVQVGFGRVGSKYWAFQLQDVVPDIVTVGKPMGNGHPISAVVTTKKIAESYVKVASRYFNTFGGNPVSCAIGNAVLDVIENEKLLQHASFIGKYALKKFHSLMDKHAIIGDVRGVGLFLGIEIVKDRITKVPATEEASQIHRRMRDRYIIISVDGPFNNVLKFKPPMCISKDDIDRLVHTLDEVLAETPVQISSKKPQCALAKDNGTTASTNGNGVTSNRN